MNCFEWRNVNANEGNDGLKINQRIYVCARFDLRIK